MKQKYKNLLIIWIAKDENGSLNLFTEKPWRKADYYWYSPSRAIELNPELFPNLTWEDEQVEVEIVVKKDYRDLYARISKSEWYNKSYNNKSIGEITKVEE